MVLVRYAVCSARKGKPLTRVVADTRPQAETELQRIRQGDANDPDDEYWIAELGPETEGWRYLVAT